MSSGIFLQDAEIISVQLALSMRLVNLKRRRARAASGLFADPKHAEGIQAAILTTTRVRNKMDIVQLERGKEAARVKTYGW